MRNLSFYRLLVTLALVLTSLTLFVACKTQTAQYRNHLYQMVSSTQEEQAKEEEEDNLQEFTWDYADQNFSITLNLSPKLNEAYKAVNRDPAAIKEIDKGNYRPYLKRLAGDNAVTQLAEKLSTIALNKGFSRQELAQFATDFVQKAISNDNEMIKAIQALNLRKGQERNIQKTPFQILFTHKAACCKGLLLKELLTELGFGTALLVVRTNDETTTHMAVGIKCPESMAICPGENYTYIETLQQLAISIVPANISTANLKRAKVTLRSDGETWIPRKAN